MAFDDTDQTDGESYDGSNDSAPAPAPAGGGAPDIQAGPPPDISALTGTTPQPAPPPGTVANPDENFAPGPLSGNTGITDAGATPSQGGGGNPISKANPQTDFAGVPLKANGQPSIWKDMVMGMIWGLAGSSGAKHFGSGMAGGAQGVMAGMQQVQENKNTAKKLEFESLEAANSAVRLRNETRAADDASALDKVKIIAATNAAEELSEERGNPPKLVVRGDTTQGMHDDATGKLPSAADMNGGKLPFMTGTQVPATGGDNQTHSVNVRFTTPDNVAGNPNGTLERINDNRRAKNLKPYDQAEMQIQGGIEVPGNWRQGAAKMADRADAETTDQGTLSKSKSSKEIGSENTSTEGYLQQRLDNIEASPDPSPKLVAVAQANLASFQAKAATQLAKAIKAENEVTKDTTPADPTKVMFTGKSDPVYVASTQRSTDAIDGFANLGPTKGSYMKRIAEAENPAAQQDIVKEAYTENTNRYNAGIQAEQGRLNRTAARQDAREDSAGKLQVTEDERYTKEVKPINATLDLVNQATASKDPNQLAASIAPLTMALATVHGIGGISRLNEYELAANNPAMVGAGNRINAWFDKNVGGTLPPEYAKDAALVLQGYKKMTDEEHNTNTDSINRNIRRIQGTPVIHNGKIAGYTTDGKNFTPVTP